MASRIKKGIHRTTARLADGAIKTYVYAWKGGPRLEAEPGTAAFDVEYARAIAAHRGCAASGTLSQLASEYRASPEFAGLAESTQAERRRFLDMIQDAKAPRAIGDLPIKAVDDPRVRQHLLAWRDQWRSTPRKADYAMQVLSALLTWAKNRGLIGTNVLIGHATLYQSNRAEITWTDEDVTRFAAAAPSPEVGFIVRLAVLTGLRRADLLRLEWAHISDIAIQLTPLKTSRRRQPRRVIVPLLDETLALLTEIKEQQERRWSELAEAAMHKGKRAPPKPQTVLSNTRGRAWTKDGAEHQVLETKQELGIDKHLHDCRGSFATRLRKAGATASEIADILGWNEARVERLLSLYVDTDDVVREFAERIRAKSAARRQS